MANGHLSALMLGRVAWNTSVLVARDILSNVEALGGRWHATFGQYPTVNDSYRTYAEQVELYRTLGAAHAAYPGTSAHGTGHALDIAVGRYGSRQWRFMNTEGRALGFVPFDEHRLSVEPWHWECYPVGGSDTAAVPSVPSMGDVDMFTVTSKQDGHCYVFGTAGWTTIGIPAQMTALGKVNVPNYVLDNEDITHLQNAFNQYVYGASR